ncbi:MAG: family 20 glycosylhydrolase [Bacteroidales bacterium]|nr:family 20 glycosylhydrolase [Candidatus Physcousia equi]
MKKIKVILAALLLSAAAPVLADEPFVVPSVHGWKTTKGNYEFTGSPNVTTQIVKNKKLGQEGYILEVTPKGVVIKGQTKRALLWGQRTLQQMTYGKTSIPCGTTTDVPEYAQRGFMMDCGRKYIPMDYMRYLVKCMSYYKMNTLQVHLNDNGFKKYFHDNWDETYAAFRLESEVFPGLSAKDGYYSKKEFRDFIRFADSLGVEIIPEIDAPAHALSFVHYRPEYGNPEFGVDHLDLSNPGVVPFLDSLYNEYLGGPDPVFCCPRVHIGTDEYNNKKEETREMFRAFTQHYIQLVKSYKKQPVLWGALTWAKGKTAIDSEGVLMDVWNNGFAQPDSMKSLGYQLVSIPDCHVYIVPAAGYYYDYLNHEFLYNKWTPANIGGKQFEEHDPQIEGGMFAVWNDVCGNGISVYDIHDRTMPALRVMAQKCWSSTNSKLPYAEWNKLASVLPENAGEQPTQTVYDSWGVLPCKSAKCNRLAPSSNVSLTATDGGNTFKMRDLGYPYTVSFDVEMANEKPGTPLFESKFAQFYLVDPVTNCVGFIRDGYHYSFDYKLVPGKRYSIRITGDNKSTSLYVNGKLIKKLDPEQRLAWDKKPYNFMRTLAFPMQRTGNYRSQVSNLVVTK